MTTSSDTQLSAQTMTQDKAEVQKKFSVGSTKHSGTASLLLATPPTTPGANNKQGDTTKFVLVGDDDSKSDSGENVKTKTKPEVQLQEKVQVQNQERVASNSREPSAIEEEKALSDSLLVIDNKLSHGQSAPSQRGDNSDTVERISPSCDGEPSTTDAVSELQSALRGLDIANTTADDSKAILGNMQHKDDTTSAIETAFQTQKQIQGDGESTTTDKVAELESALKGLAITKTSVARPQSRNRARESKTKDKVSELESALKGLEITKTSVARPQIQGHDGESVATFELESALTELEITNTSVDNPVAIRAKKLPEDVNVNETEKAVCTRPQSQHQIKAQDPSASTRLQGSLSLSQSTSDAMVNFVGADSPTLRSRPATHDLSSAANKQEVSTKTLQKSDVRRSQPKVTAKKDGSANVTVVNKSPKLAIRPIARSDLTMPKPAQSSAGSGNSQSKVTASPGTKHKWSSLFSSKRPSKRQKGEEDLASGDLVSAVSSLAITPSIPSAMPSLVSQVLKPPVTFDCHDMFPANVSRSESEISLPKLGDRIKNTPQLVLCARLAKTARAALPPPISAYPPDQLKWIEDLESHPFEKEHLYRLVTRMVDAFIQHPSKDFNIIREIVLLGPTLDKEHYRKLLNCFLTGFGNDTLLDVNLLRGLVQLVQCASEGYLIEEDLVIIMSILRVRLQDAHQRPSEHLYDLALALSNILDVMVRHEVKDLQRVEQHEPLQKVLSGLQGSSDPFLMYQASYAFQALQFIPDNETVLQAVMRHSGVIADGLINVSGIVNLDLGGFLKGLGQIQQTTVATIGILKAAAEGARSLIESGQSAFQAIQGGINSRNKRAWYPAVVGASAMVQKGKLYDFKVVVTSAACRAKDIPYPLGFQVQLPDHWPLLDQVQEIPTVERDINRLRDQRLEDYRQSVYIPPLAKPSLQALDKDALPLMDMVQEFLRSDQQVFLVLGDSGAGKSTFNRHLERELWSSYKPGEAIPLFINLPAIDRPDQDLIRKQLQLYNFSDIQIQELKRHYRIILICDGYDETQLKVNLHTSNLLNQKGQPDTKMIISCRSGFVDQDYRHQFQPQQIDRYRATETNLYKEAAIAPFLGDQIQDYVRQFVQDPEVHKLMGDRAVWSSDEYMDKLSSIPNLMELVKNPFLLTLALRALPSVVEGASDIAKIRMTRLTLYNSFIDQWLAVNQDRLTSSLTNSNPSKDTKVALQELLAEGFAASALDFLKDLAATIFHEQNGNPVVQYRPRRDKNTWKARFFSFEPDVTLLRDSSPLSRVGDQYRFIHRSLLEYFYCRHIHEAGDTDTEDTDMETNGSQDLTNHPLRDRNLVREPSIIQFLSEYAQEDLVFKERLHQIIQLSKADEQAGQAAANAITILVRAGVRFNGADLNGIRIPGADLSYGELDSVQLQGADLRNTTLRNIWLRRADLTNACLDNAEFGELPSLLEPDIVNCCVFSPDGSTFATGIDDGSISVYDTTTWKTIHTFEGHTEGVWGVVYSPTGQQIASRSWDHTVRLWDMQTGSHGPILTGHTGEILGVVYSPSGRVIASCSRDGTARLWDAESGSPGPVLRGHIQPVTAVVFSPNGQKVVSCGSDNMVRFWDAQTGAPGPILSGHTSYVWRIAFSSDGRQIVSCSEDGAVRLWDAVTGSPGPLLNGHTELVWSVVYSPNGRQIASCSDDNTVRLWDAQTGSPGFTLIGHTDAVRCVAYSPSGRQIATGSVDHTVRLWDTETGSPGPVLCGHSGIVMSVVYSPSGQLIASGGLDVTVRLWSAQTDSPGPVLNSHTKAVRSVEYAPNGHQIASSSEDKTIRLWDAETGTSGPVLCGHTQIITDVQYSPNGRQLVTCSADKTIRLWDSQTGAPVSLLGGHTGYVWCAVFSPNGLQIASCSQDSTVRLWDLQARTPGPILNGHTGPVRNMVYSPSGRQIASCSDDKTVYLWDAHAGEPCFTLNGHTDAVCDVKYSPSGQQLVSCSADKTLRLWDPQTGSSGPTLSGHTSTIQCVVYSPDGQQLASCSNDGSIRLWNASNGSPGNVLRGHSGWVLCAAYSPEGHLIASGGGDLTARLWDPKSGQCLTILEDFHQVVASVAWNPLASSSHLVTGCRDGSVRLWQVLAEKDGYQARLHGPSNHDRLVLSDVTLKDVKGLSLKNKNLFLRYGTRNLELQRGDQDSQDDDSSEEHSVPTKIYVHVEDPDDAHQLYDMGLLFDEGDEDLGVSKDDSLAAKWYLKAAKKGHASAQLCIGTMYADGLGVPQDDSKAVEWLLQAASQENAAAQYAMGVMCAEGRGIEQDSSKAIEWFTKAANQGIDLAQSALDLMNEESKSDLQDEPMATP
ncbi:protein HIRA/HIR1 [Entomortierella parvispora]|uniref:Protein HIRA/HIR1 n=1 Tax=Entomortierella parvispora TaxID=205924 RepID=A0A9P3M0R7_9FUNG|nr:protein HIRA/HIR1 [Entomortierella parvispora]